MFNRVRIWLTRHGFKCLSLEQKEALSAYHAASNYEENFIACRMLRRLGFDV